MSLAVHFDTLGYVEQAEKLGISNEIAKFQARAIEKAVDTIAIEVKTEIIQEIKQELRTDELATKSDVLAVRKDLDIVKLEPRKEMEVIRKEIEGVRKEIAQANTKTIIWVSGIMGTFGVFFLGILAKGFHWI